MLTAVEVENFRGIERLSVSGLGRVNLIIGKNDSGKTALMESMWVAQFPEEAGAVLTYLPTRIPDVEINDFDRTWRPFFRSEDAERGFLIKATHEHEDPVRIIMRSPGKRMLTGGPSLNPHAPLRASSWTLEYEVERRGHSERFQISRRPDGELSLPPELIPYGSAFWASSGGPYQVAGEIASLSQLKEQGNDGLVVSLLRKLDERIEGLEILSPGGTEASIFVRLAHEPKLLPFRLMGDGVQRCLDIALALVSNPVIHLSIDELENGLHHSVLEPVWRWLAQSSLERNIQLFATTHSEECVQAACRAFSALNDDGLRVIRLDRQEHQTVATVYDRNLVEAAGRMGVEIRG